MAEEKKTEKKMERPDLKDWGVFKRLSRARHAIGATDIPKSGRNKYAGFDYHELKDILPPINKYNDFYGLADIIDISEERDVASIEIFNVDDRKDSISFSIPYTEAEMLAKGGAPSTVDAIQRLGSTVTYIRRYLYLLAYNIVESDAVDSTVDSTQPKEGSKSPAKKKSFSKAKTQASKSGSGSKVPATKPQLGLIEKLQKNGKVSKDYDFTGITKSEASDVIKAGKDGKDIPWTKKKTKTPSDSGTSDSGTDKTVPDKVDGMPDVHEQEKEEAKDGEIRDADGGLF